MDTQQDLTFELDKPMDASGFASSDFQNNPLKDDGTDSRSDWGYEVVRKNAGGKTGITGSTNPGDMPRFDKNYDKIINAVGEMNSDTFRISLDFGRLCPEKGVFDEELMKHYIRILANCKRKGIDPMITLHHWTAPSSFAKYDQDGKITAGPLEHPEIVEHFNFYVNKVAEFLCDPDKIRTAVAEEGYDKNFVDSLCDERLLAKWFITINEPVNLVFTPYMLGAFPPYKFASFLKYPGLVRKVKAMHDQSYDTIHEKSATTFPDRRGPKVGIAHNVTNSYLPGYEGLANWGLVERIEDGSLSDIMGVQYYFRFKLGLISPFIAGSDPRYVSDHPQFGQIYAPGIEEVLKYAGKNYPEKELMVTEYGFADKTDQKRPSWILDTVGHILKAKMEGVPVNGVLYWSIINNEEWAQGMDPPFGILDKDGNRLQSDDGRPGHISSREVITAVHKHLRNPAEQSAASLRELQKRARTQLNNSVAIQKV